MNIKMKGKTLSLSSEPIKIGKELDFIATNLDMSDFRLSDIKNQFKIISVIPSIDTAVCATQTKKVNTTLNKIENVQLITISRDLPFACKRFCSDLKLGNHLFISDYKYHDFGNKTGLVIKDLEILTRALLFVDKDNIIQYLAINDEVATEPDYDALMRFLKSYNNNSNEL